MAITNEKGIVAHKSQIETGTSKSGNPWQKMSIVIAVEGWKEPFNKISLSVFGDRVDQVKGINEGDKVSFSYSISAREYNGKWFNDVSLFGIEAEGKAEEKPAPTNDAPVINPLEAQDGDLPF